MITLYLHKFHDGEVVAYADQLGMRRIALWNKDYTNRPTKRNKYIMLNCNKYKIEWI